MGKVKPDLAGAYVSKVGGVAYYIKDGVNYVRSLSKSGYKSNTPLQAGVKARFKSASQMAGQMKEIAKVVRWTGILDTETDWKVENHGVNGRSIPHTVSTVKFACQQVRDWHRKPNSVWLLVMLGTNDLLENPDFTAADVAKRMERFLKRMMEEAGLASRKMRLRLIAPPAMQEGQWVDRPELLTESRNLGKEYKRIAKRLGIAFTDASGWEIPTIYDGVHFTKEGHRIFAENIRKELNI